MKDSKIIPRILFKDYALAFDIRKIFYDTLVKYDQNNDYNLQ